MTSSTHIDPSTAAFLSFLIPGWGQMRRGKTIQGLIWLVVVIAGYFLLIIPRIDFAYHLYDGGLLDGVKNSVFFNVVG